MKHQYGDQGQDCKHIVSFGYTIFSCPYNLKWNVIHELPSIHSIIQSRTYEINRIMQISKDGIGLKSKTLIYCSLKSLMIIENLLRKILNVIIYYRRSKFSIKLLKRFCWQRLWILLRKRTLGQKRFWCHISNATSSYAHRVFEALRIHNNAKFYLTL